MSDELVKQVEDALRGDFPYGTLIRLREDHTHGSGVIFKAGTPGMIVGTNGLGNTYWVDFEYTIVRKTGAATNTEYLIYKENLELVP